MLHVCQTHWTVVTTLHLCLTVDSRFYATYVPDTMYCCYYSTLVPDSGQSFYATCVPDTMDCCCYSTLVPDTIDKRLLHSRQLLLLCTCALHRGQLFLCYTCY